MKRIYKALWEELRLDPKFRSMFELCNITTVSDLLQRKRYGLLKTKNVGTGTLNRLELILAKSRLHLQPGPKKM